MKLVNFASFDPIQQERGIRGLSNAAQADREIWEHFQGNWSRRADPRNGIALCAFHDRAFDRGLKTVRCDLTTWVSEGVKSKTVTPMQEVGLVQVDGRKIRMPGRLAPDPVALEYHNRHVFRQKGLQP